MLIYNAALSDHSTEKVQGYLAHKWGLSDQMPTSHPHKTSRPLFENRGEILLKSPYSVIVDQNLSLLLSTNRSVDQITSSNLPPGLDLNNSSLILQGKPTTVGTFLANFETSNSAGSLPQQITFLVKDFRPWIYGADINFPGYSEVSSVSNFPVYVELNSSISGFSYEQFVSQYGHDLRFLTSDGKTELAYEPIEWNLQGTSSFWVLLDKLDANTTIRAIWGNPNYQDQPAYCRDGTVWQKYRAVWHMDGDDPTLVRDSRASYHATPYNFDELRTAGVIGRAVNFDGINDFLSLPLDSHPPAGTEKLTISFWTHGNFPTLINSTLFESGSALGRHLNVHFPWSNSRFYWDAGMSNQYDRVEKEDSNYLGAWIYWTLQKDTELGVMRIYKNGDLFMEGFNKTRPFGGPVENFRLGSARLGGAWWNGWVDEFRIGLFMESPESIRASYASQRPDSPSNFSLVSSVEGPPVILKGQIAEGFANDSLRPLSYFISVFPSASSFSGVGLPAGISLNSSTGELSGAPLQGGAYKITITASNAFGSSQEIVSLRISEVSGFSHSVELSMAGYTGAETLTDFPMLVHMSQAMDANFSLNSFASTQGNDLRFFDEVGRDLPFEIESIDFSANLLVAWVRVAELNSSKSIFAYWGNPSLSSTPPETSTDGSTWILPVSLIKTFSAGMTYCVSALLFRNIS